MYFFNFLNDYEIRGRELTIPEPLPCATPLGTFIDTISFLVLVPIIIIYDGKASYIHIPILQLKKQAA